jgi:hypothetical protein
VKKGLCLAAAIAAFSALALPGSAAAVVYCVDDTPGDLEDNNLIHPSCETGAATIPSAFISAQASGTDVDTVRIGPGDYDVLVSGGAGYFANNPANNVSVIGAGAAETRLSLTNTAGSMTGLQVQAPPGSTVEDLSMMIPANIDGSGDTGIGLFGGTAGIGLLVEGPAASNASGVRIAGPSELRDSTVDLQVTSPSNIAVRQTGGSPAVLDSELGANTGVTASGTASTTTVERSVIEATVGTRADSGEIVVQDTLIDLGGASNAVGVEAANFNNGIDPIAATVDGTTIVNGGSNSIGVRSLADSAVGGDPNDTVDDGENAAVEVSNTVISDVTNALKVEADRGQTAELTTSYSNYDAGTVVDNPDISGGNATGTTNLITSDQTNLPPGFVDVDGANYHLASVSALIDIGDPADPPPGSTDIDGDPRGLRGTPDCAQESGRRDIGADEQVPSLLDCESPETTITGGPQGPSRNPRPTFSFMSEPDASFECRFDGQGAFAACSGPAATHTPAAALGDGPHTFEVRAIDAALNPDPTPATRSFVVDATAPETTVKGRKRFATIRKRARVRFLLSASEPGSTFQCKVDRRPFRACAPPYRTPGLKRGKHVLRVRATDAIGNPDATPAVKRFRIVRTRRS